MVSNLQRYDKVFSFRLFVVAFKGISASNGKKIVIFANDKNHNSMNMGQLREKYERFRQWQECPHEYKLMSDEVHHCNNCNHDFTGNFCPICSQKAGMGRIGWKSVRQGIMDIWGLGTRSLLYSIWQLLWRPGQVIGDYLDGKRQVSFPPVKMLFIIAVIYSVLFYWFFPTVLGIEVLAVPYMGNEEARKVTEDMMNLAGKYYSWAALIFALIAVVPTWIMFRYSPRHTSHSLPEGFFIQVFLANLMIVLGFLLFPIGIANPSLYTFSSFIAYAIYYLIVYKYLFGYSFWGTLWRCGFIYAASTLFAATGLSFMFDNRIVANNLTEAQMTQMKMFFAGSYLLLSVTVLTVGFVINYIVTRKFRRELKQSAIHSHS